MAKMVEKLDGREFVSFLEDNGIPSVLAESILEERIDGALFLQLTEQDIAELCPKRIGDRIRIRLLLRKLKVS